MDPAAAVGDGDGRDAARGAALDLLGDLAEVEFGHDEGLDLLGQLWMRFSGKGQTVMSRSVPTLMPALRAN